MKQSGQLSGNTFTTKENGLIKTYSIHEKSSERTFIDKNDSDISDRNYTHVTRVAHDENGNRAGTIESGATGNSHVLNTNNR